MEIRSVSKRKISVFLKQQSALFILILLVVLGSIMFADRFPTLQNFSNILRQVSFIGIISTGVTLVILTGGIDLSVGSIFALCGVIVSYIQNLPLALIILIPIVAGAIMGLINCTIIVKLRVVPFIATLATMMGFRGIAYLLTNGGITRSISNENFIYLGRGHLFGVLPIPTVIFIIIVFAAMFVMKYTRFGRHIYAVGGNSEAAKMMGLNINTIHMAVYIINGMLAGLAGILLSARMGSGSPVAGMGYELDAICATVLGGTLLSGGVGNVSGTFFGAIALLVVGNMMNMQGHISSPVQEVIQGLIILVVIVLQSRVKKVE